MPKNKTVSVEVEITLPRGRSGAIATIKLDPANIALSDKPSMGEVTKAAKDLVLDALKVKVLNGREVLAALKEARAAEVSDEDSPSDE